MEDTLKYYNFAIFMIVLIIIMSRWSFDYALSVVEIYYYKYIFLYVLFFSLVKCEAVLDLLLPPLTNSLAVVILSKPINAVLCVPACAPYLAFC